MDNRILRSFKIFTEFEILNVYKTIRLIKEIVEADLSSWILKRLDIEELYIFFEFFFSFEGESIFTYLFTMNWFYFHFV